MLIPRRVYSAKIKKHILAQVSKCTSRLSLFSNAEANDDNKFSATLTICCAMYVILIFINGKFTNHELLTV